METAKTTMEQVIRFRCPENKTSDDDDGKYNHDEDEGEESDEERAYRQTLTTLARMKAIKAPHASDWKAALPSNKHNTLSDPHYRIAAHINLGLTMPHLPPHCQGCGGKIPLSEFHRHTRQE